MSNIGEDTMQMRSKKLKQNIPVKTTEQIQDSTEEISEEQMEEQIGKIMK